MHFGRVNAIGRHRPGVADTSYTAAKVMAMDDKEIHLDDAAQQLFSQIDGIEDTKSSVSDSRKEIQVSLNRELAA